MDAAAQREESRAALNRQLSEERLSRLWAERRELFARVLDSADEWRRANLDLAGVRLSEYDEGQVRLDSMTMRAAQDASPEVARALDCMYSFGRLLNEVHLLSDAEVRGAVSNLRKVLRSDMRRAAVESVNDSVEVSAAEELVHQAMRRELVAHR